MNRYSTAAALKQAVETRLRSSSSNGTDFARRRQLLVFDRFLARITRELGDSAILKGGLVVELRVERARTTKDIDLRLVGPPTGLLERLRRAAGLELGDFMLFTVMPDEGMVYEGQRHHVTCALAGKPYGLPFGLDIAFADPILGEPDIVVAADVLGFAGIEPPTLRLYPLETHIAEKLHADTLPRKRPSSRVKDLPGIALRAGVRELEATDLHLTEDARASRLCSTTASRMGSTVRTHGRGGRAGLGRPRDPHTRCRRIPRPRARRQGIANLDAIDVAVGAVGTTPRPSSAAAPMTIRFDPFCTIRLGRRQR